MHQLEIFHEVQAYFYEDLITLCSPLILAFSLQGRRNFLLPLP